MLTACGGEAPKPAAPDAAPIAADTDSVADVAGNEVAKCGPLTPLLRVLPAAKNVNGLPERYRSCEPGEYAVTSGYYDEGDHPSEYKFRVQLLRGDSPYARDAVNPPDATDEQRAFLREAVTRIGDMVQTRFGLCRNYATNPTIPGGRTPTLATIKGVEVCFSDDRDANKEVWHAIATQNNLAFELELTGAKAAAIATTVEAQAHLAPFFEGFLLDEAAQ
jgi:hypothetical protein